MSQFIRNFLKLSTTSKAIVGVTAVATLAVMGGCMKTAYEVLTPNDIQQTIDSIPKNSVVLKGTFTQNLEQSVFDDGTTKYYVYDPNHLLAVYAKSKGQTGVSVSVPVCIEGRVSDKGRYGHLGRYDYELWVDKICD